MKNFYSLSNWQASATEIKATVRLDASHPLFEGHFPNLPILPGACMVQLTHQLLDKHFEKPCTFLKAGNIKFLIPVNPLQEPELEAHLKMTEQADNTLRVEQVLSKGEKTFFKFSALYQKP